MQARSSHGSSRPPLRAFCPGRPRARSTRAAALARAGSASPELRARRAGWAGVVDGSGRFLLIDTDTNYHTHTHTHPWLNTDTDTDTHITPGHVMNMIPLSLSLSLPPSHA